MGKYSEVYVAFDTAKLKHAVAIAEGGRQGEVRFVGEIANQPATIERLIRKLAGRYSHRQACFEAGPTGYGLYRQIRALGHECLVVAPSLIPRRSGDRVKTNRSGGGWSRRSAQVPRHSFKTACLFHRSAQMNPSIISY